MGKIGTWSYWFKTKDGEDVVNTTNKLDIPKNCQYILLFKHHKPDGNIDEEMSIDGKIILKHKNINKIDGCAKFHLSMETFEKIYETLDVKYPEAKYKKILNKKLKQNPAMKGCKIK